eukprot:scaffold7418_cov31-Tisochrysis_lutea.AAC.2
MLQAQRTVADERVVVCACVAALVIGGGDVEINTRPTTRSKGTTTLTKYCTARGCSGNLRPPGSPRRSSAEVNRVPPAIGPRVLAQKEVRCA